MGKLVDLVGEGGSLLHGALFMEDNMLFMTETRR